MCALELSGKRLDMNRIVPLAPAHPGTDHYNHEGCPAGLDTKRRLYVTLTDDGTILAYCHHCGHRGYLKSRTVTSIHPPSHSYKPGRTMPRYEAVINDPYLVERGLVREVDSYLMSWGVDLVLAQADGWLGGIGMRKEQDVAALVFPCFDWEGFTTGFQIRFLPTEGRPLHGAKVRSYGKVGPHIFNPCDNPHLVIVEDRVSANRLAQLGYATLTMHGAKALMTQEAHALSMMFDRFTVWYDNDGPLVEDAAQCSYNSLSLFTKEARLISAADCILHGGASITQKSFDPKRFKSDQVVGIMSCP